jgi:hypothetical protein
LKSKSNPKRDHSLGTLNKNRILEILPRLSQKKGFEKGITLTDISKETKAKFPPKGFSKPTIISALKKLQADNRIFKSKSRYFLTDLFQDDGWSIFAGYLNYLLEGVSFHVLPVHIIRNINQSGAEENIGELLTQFSNYIGIFILYLLTETMRPTQKIIPTSMRVDKALDFIQTAMPYSDLFRAFLNFLPESYSKDIVLGAQMKEDSFKKLSNAFKKIYPSIYTIIEGGYSRYFQNFYLGILDNDCKHDWKETFVHKLGTHYRCTTCRSMVKSLARL